MHAYSAYVCNVLSKRIRLNYINSMCSKASSRASPVPK